MLTILRFTLTSLLAFVILACGQPTGQEAPAGQATVDQTQYDLFPIPGSSLQRAELRNADGVLTESGFMANGVRQGTWTTYDEKGEVPRKMVSYVDGALNGPYLELDDQSRLAVVAGYKNNVLHGHYGKYRIGRPELTVNYVDGQMDGVLSEYNYRNNKLKQEVHYKMGKKHGPLRHYNDEEKVVLEYIYENDERVSGGIVE